MKLVDTHCHLCHSRLRQDINAVLARAREAGVAAFICAAADLHESKAAGDLAQRESDVYCIAGVHPHEAKDVPDDYLAQLERLAADAKNVAVGEVGLDYHYNFSPPEAQREVFAAQLALARRLGKPVVIHTREAFDDTLAILAEAGADGSRVVFHSFTGSADEARRALNFGAMVGFSGIVTFKNAGELCQTAGLVPDDRLLIETDSPYLSPEPLRKMKTNEPANILHIAERLAVVRRTTPDALAELTTANAIRFFGIDRI